MSDVQHNQAPAAGEEIHLPGPSIVPLINAAGITIALLGLTTIRPLLYVGLVIFVWSTIVWIRHTKRDIEELPLEHH